MTSSANMADVCGEQYVNNIELLKINMEASYNMDIKVSVSNVYK